MKAHEKPTLDELEHIRKHHLDIKIHRERRELSISYVLDCKEGTCPVPQMSVAFYVCPCKPCPPGTA